MYPAPASPAVTVIVPVYNPGRYIEGCISSLLAQTMPAGQFEVLFVDDGSTDSTPARLAALAAEHGHIRVITQENSGWPGKPRNVGMDAAAGDYVQFLDQDDALGPEALERMYAIGARNDADIVLGKVTSDFRGVPHGVFRHTVERCTIHDAPLIDSLTPHKMFRRAFLDEHGIRYPEGKRRLEDQLFMVRTYLPARSVSIIGDYPCYFYKKRADGRNAGSTRIEPKGYYGNLREVLDVVEAGTEEGDFRNSLLRRFYRVEMLGRLSEPSMPTYPDDFRRELFGEVRRLSAERIPAAVDAGLLALPRVRSLLLREDRLEDLVDIAGRARSVANRAHLGGLAWRDGVLYADLSAQLLRGDGTPLVLTERDGRVVLDDWLVGGLADDATADVTADLAEAKAEVVIKNRDTAVEWFVPAELRMEDGAASAERPVVFRGTARLDPQTLAGGAPLERGAWDIAVRIHAFGLVKRTRLGSRRDPAADAGALPAILGTPAHAVLPYFTAPYGNLSFDVEEFGKSLVKELPGGRAGRAGVDAATVSLPLPIVTTAGSGELPAEVVLSAGPDSARLTLPARIVATGGRAEVRALVSESVPGPVGALRNGTYDLSLGTRRPNRPPLPVGTVTIEGGGARAASASARRVSRRGGTVTERVIAAGRRTVDRLPPAASRRALRVGRRLLGRTRA